MLCCALQTNFVSCKVQILSICKTGIGRREQFSALARRYVSRYSSVTPVCDLGNSSFSIHNSYTNSFSTATEKDKMEKIYEEKTALRERMKTVLAGLTTEDKNTQSEMVKQKLFNHDKYKQSKRVSIFLNMDDEVQTLDILKDLLDKQKTVFIPRYSGKLGRMDMVKLDSWQDYENLPLTRWNIKQPAMNDPRENAFETGGLDLTIMPGLAFTKTGRRLGRGKGYYDAFLTRYAVLSTGKPYSLAVAFKQQILPNIPVTDKDVIIDEVLTAD